MKIREWILPVLVFSSFLFAGRWTGVQIEKSVKAASDQRLEEQLALTTRFDSSAFSENSFAPARLHAEMPAEHLPLPTSQAAPTHHQRNILIIGIDDLALAHPRLFGIWLALYLPDQPRITMVPVYPGVIASSGQPIFYLDEELANTFNLSTGGELDDDFLNQLTAKGLWWSNYAVVDGEAVNALLRFAGDAEPAAAGDTTPGSAMEHNKIVLPSHSPVDDPGKALLAQLNAAQQACHARNPKFTARQIADFMNSLDGHLLTDVSAEQIASDLKNMLLFGGGLMCEFPSLTFFNKT